MVKLWTNFAKYGNPTPAVKRNEINVVWPPIISEEELVFLNINRDLSTICNPHKERILFWDEFFTENQRSKSQEICS